jgi:hypothetical protein
VRLFDHLVGAKLRKDGPMRAVAAVEFRSRGGTLFSMRECNDYLKKSLDRNTTGRSAWTCSSKNLRDDKLARQAKVIITGGGPPAAFAAKAATTTIPIVFLVGEDPTRLGLDTSLARPSGSLTGVNMLANELGQAVASSAPARAPSSAHRRPRKPGQRRQPARSACNCRCSRRTLLVRSRKVLHGANGRGRTPFSLEPLPS